MSNILSSLGSFVDPACPVAWGHPLNRGLVNWYNAVPNTGWRSVGTYVLRDAVRGGKKPTDGTITGSGYVWQGETRPRINGGPITPVSLTASSYGNWITFGGYVPSTAVTISMWIYDGTNRNHAYIYAGDDAYNSNLWDWALFHWNGTLYLQTTPGQTVTTSPQNNVWNHFVINRATGQCYKNAILLGTCGTASGGTKALRCASSDNNYNSYWGFDSFQIFNRSLSAGEVRALYIERKKGNPETLNWISSKLYSIPTVTASNVPVFMNQYRQRRS